MIDSDYQCINVKFITKTQRVYKTVIFFIKKFMAIVYFAPMVLVLLNLSGNC